MGDLKPTKDTEKKIGNLSKKDLLKLKANRMAFIREQLPSLKLEDQYTTHKANIAENTYREHLSRLKMAELKAASMPPPEKKEDDSEKTKSK